MQRSFKHWFAVFAAVGLFALTSRADESELLPEKKTITTTTTTVQNFDKSGKLTPKSKTVVDSTTTTNAPPPTASPLASNSSIVEEKKVAPTITIDSTNGLVQIMPTEGKSKEASADTSGSSELLSKGESTTKQPAQTESEQVGTKTPEAGAEQRASYVHMPPGPSMIVDQDNSCIALFEDNTIRPCPSEKEEKSEKR